MYYLANAAWELKLLWVTLRPNEAEGLLRTASSEKSRRRQDEVAMPDGVFARSSRNQLNKGDCLNTARVEEREMGTRQPKRLRTEPLQF